MVEERVLSAGFPQKFGRYWLQEKMGHGGMAEVFRATLGPDPHTYAFDIALKRLHPHLEGDRNQVDMFMTEADVAKVLKHENIVRVYEAGLIDGHAFIAMEYIWGLDLSQVIQRLRQKRIRLPPDLALYVVLQIVRALDYVHRAEAPGGQPMEMIHRDVTPSNIYVTYDGHVKLADFGVARVSFLESDDERQTLKGKVSYMPPELLAGGELEPGVDLWAISVTLYEMLAMQKIYEGTSETDIMAGTVIPRMRRIESLNPSVDPRLAKLMRTLLHAKRRRRPMNAVDMYRRVKSCLEGLEVVVDANALGRFLRDAIGVDPTSGPKIPSGSPTGNFMVSDYRAPIEMSPTQRLSVVAKKRTWIARAMLAVLFLLIGGVACVFLLRGAGDPASGSDAVAEVPAVVAPPDKPAPGVVPSDTSASGRPAKKPRKRRRSSSKSTQKDSQN